MVFADCFLWFIIYSFIGWLWETGLYIVRDKKFVNRGFLNGTLCPIYGFGAVACIIALYGRVTNPIILFLFGLIICTGIEYFTHWLLEVLFHTVWWDYSKEKFNIKGRVCLLCAVFFGVMIVVLIDIVHPLIAQLTASIPDKAKFIITLVIYSVLLVDATLTINVLIDLNRKLKALQFSIGATIQSSIDSTEEMMSELKEKKETKKETVPYPEHYFGWRAQNLLKHYPNAKSIRYKEALDNVKVRLAEVKKSGGKTKF